MRQQLINSSSILIADFSRVCFSSFFPHNYTGTSSLTLRLIASFDGVNQSSEKRFLNNGGFNFATINFWEPTLLKFRNSCHLLPWLTISIKF
ncbi:Uncharacterized protein TPS_09095 [Trichinella pseudospiralis]